MWQISKLVTEIELVLRTLVNEVLPIIGEFRTGAT